MTSHSKIEQAALQLFGEKGYDNTSTALIARQAGVSEALLFKYFLSKEKLFEYLIKQGFRRIVEANRGILAEQDPRTLIENVIDLPYKLVQAEPDFWKVQDKEFNRPLVQKYFQRFMSPIDNLLQQAFIAVGVPQTRAGHAPAVVAHSEPVAQPALLHRRPPAPPGRAPEARLRAGPAGRRLGRPPPPPKAGVHRPA